MTLLEFTLKGKQICSIVYVRFLFINHNNPLGKCVSFPHLMVRSELIERNELVAVWDVRWSHPVEVQDHRVLVLQVGWHLGLSRLGRRVQGYRLGQLRRRVGVCKL